MLNIGIIGAGSIVESSHLPVLKNINKIHVSWIFDINETRSELLAKMYKIPTVIKNNQWKDALNEIDICLLAVPYGVRQEYINAVSEKNKFLYVEKPFAISTMEHSTYCSLFPEYAIAIGFQRRFYKTVWTLMNIINSKIFGNLKEIYFNQGYFNIKGGLGYLSDSNLSGGGIIIESAIHAFDQIFYLSNALQIRIINSNLLSQEKIEYEATIEAEIITSDNNIKFFTEVSTLKNLDNGIKLNFDHAQINCDLSPESRIIVSSKNSTGFTINDHQHNNIYANSIVKSFHLFWLQFLNALEHKTVNLTSAISSLITTKFIEDVYEYKK